MTDAIPADWTAPQWLKPYSKRELQWLASAQHDRNTRLQIECRRLRHEQTDASGTAEADLPTTPAEQE